jgi:homoserine kinase
VTILRRSTAVEVQVPATSANLGPGYDCLGLALALHDRLIAVVTDDPGVRVDVEGAGAGVLPVDETHLVVQAAARGFDAMGVELPGLLLRCSNSIPQGRGLGSSAAAIIAGLMIARGLVEGGDELLPDSIVLDLATGMEGHPDNVAAALLGGFTTAWIESPDDDPPHASALVRPPHSTVRPVVAVPQAPVATSHARELLDSSVSRESAVFNIARAAALTHAVSTDPSLLFTATEDRLHQDARASAYPRSHEVMSTMRAQGFPAVISGAGPTVLILTDSPDDAMRALSAVTDDTWHLVAVEVDNDGVRSRTRSLG